MRSEAHPPANRPADPLVFAVGCPRSGTTLLQRILDAHPDLAVANDTHFVPRCLQRHSPRALAAARSGHDVPLTPALVAQVRAYRRTSRLGLDERSFERAAERAETYASFVGALYEELAAMRGKRFGGEKTPDYVRHLPLLAAMFPASRFVHIVRDGREVALSVLQWATASKGPGKLPSWRDDPLATAALWWRWMVRSGRDAAPSIGGERYLEVRYDDLVEAPQATAEQLCAFLGLRFAPEMLAYHEGRMRDGAGLSAKQAWLPPTAGLRDWHVQMSAVDVELFEALAGDLLDELGFERSAPAPGRVPAARAAAFRRRWGENPSARRTGAIRHA